MIKKLACCLLLAFLTACIDTCPPDPDADCIDPALINEGAFCPANVDPVCGCDGKTYTNSCEATKAGVISVTAGACPKR